jgi:hypothetical protein
VRSHHVQTLITALIATFSACLLATPLVGEGVSQHARSHCALTEGCRERVGEVDRHGIFSAGTHDRALPFFGDAHLARGQETCPPQNELLIQGKRGSEPPAVGDAAGGHHRGLSGDLPNLREDEPGNFPGATARLCALRDDDIDTARLDARRAGNPDLAYADHDAQGFATVIATLTSLVVTNTKSAR